MAFQGPKGTRDYYPEEKEVFNWMVEKFRKVALSYGYREVESPAFENLTLLCEKEGEEIKQQIFTLEKRGKEEFGLRFDLTVPITRMFIARQKELPKPVKWFYITRMWRYEQPQRGRLREFYQFGIELFGSRNPDADAEIISMAIDALLSLGLAKDDFKVKLNNRDLLQGLIEGVGIKNVNDVIIIIDKMAKISEEEFVAELEKKGLTLEQLEILDKLIRIKDLDELKNLNEKAKQGLAQLKKVLDLLVLKKDFIEIDLTCARGLAYYTGNVFEIYDKEGKYRALCGGGRYDKMVEQFGGSPEPATGFGMGFATIRLLLDEKMKYPDSELGVDYYIAPIGDVKKQAMEIAEKLRQKGKSVEINLMDRSLKKQIEYADKLGARNLIVVGEDEIERRVLKIKNMLSGEEQELAFSDL